MLTAGRCPSGKHICLFWLLPDGTLLASVLSGGIAAFWFDGSVMNEPSPFCFFGLVLAATETAGGNASPLGWFYGRAKTLQRFCGTARLRRDAVVRVHTRVKSLLWWWIAR
jgi:hypothetical protein